MTLMNDIFMKLESILDEGMQAMRSMRGADRDGFNYMMLENVQNTEKTNFLKQLSEDFDEDLLNDVKEDCRSKGIDVFTPGFLNELKNQYQEKRYSSSRMFFDMDGVLYVFDNMIESLDVLYEENYFRSRPLHQMVAYSMKNLLLENPHQIYILSHYIDSPFAFKEKMECLQDHFPELDRHNIILVPYSQEKTSAVPLGVKSNDILIDDYNNNLNLWQKAGGTAVKMVNGINDVHKSWTGSRVRYDDPQLSNELDHYLNTSYAKNLAQGIVDKTEELVRDHGITK